MKSDEHRDWRIIHYPALEFLTRRWEKVNRMWCETPSCHISERDFLVRKKGSMEGAAQAGTLSVAHATQAQWPFVWHVLDDQKLSEQLARHLEMLDKGLEPSSSSHTTLPAEKGGISPSKSRCMTAPSITPTELLRNKCSLVPCYVNTITLR